MTLVYPWLAHLAEHCAHLSKPCGVLIAGAPHTGLDRFVIALLAERWAIVDPSNHPDVLCIETQDKAIGIGEIRELVNFTKIKPTRLECKFVIINPICSLTVAAQQAFLKTLEESLVPTYFFMLCHNMNRILPTIKSRSQTMIVGEISRAAILDYAKRQGLSFDEHDLLIGQYAPLYHERPDYPSFKKIFSESLALCRSGESWPSVNHAWDKVAPEIQLNAMILANAQALKQDYKNAPLQKSYSALLEVTRLKEVNPNINLVMHLDAVKAALN